MEDETVEQAPSEVITQEQLGQVTQILEKESQGVVGVRISKDADGSVKIEPMRHGSIRRVEGVEVFTPYPRYKCHKEVSALKIASVIRHGSSPGASLSFEESTHSDISVSDAFLAKHCPEAGGYYVIYPDGYASFSPADAFESGYSLIEG